MGTTETSTTYCRICEPLCGLVATVQDGRLRQLSPDRQHPLSQGFACPKGLAMGEVQDDADRVLHPLRRRSDGTFEEVSWDEALDGIAARLRGVLRLHGGESIGYYVGNPLAFNLTATLWLGGFTAAVGARHGYSVGSQDINSRFVASKLLYGTLTQVPFPDLPHTDFLLMLGANPLVSRGSGIRAPRLREHLNGIVARGGRVVVLDPRRTETARAYEHVVVRPDTDAYLLAAMIQVIFAEGRTRIPAYVEGADRLRAAVASFPPERVAAITGVSADQVRSLARDFAAAPRAAAYGRTGACLGRHSTLINVLLDALCVITDNLDRRGGLRFSRAPLPMMEWAERVGQLTYDRSRSRIGGFPDVMGTYPSTVMAAEITTRGPGSLRAMFVLAGNPVLTAPDGAALAAALPQLDLLVSLDLYVNETNRHADYVLPATTMLERPDLPFAIADSTPWPHLQYTPEVLLAQGEAKQEWWVLEQLARRLDLTLFAPPAAQRALAPLRRRALRRGGAQRLPDPWRIVDLLLRAGPFGDLFGLRPGGLTLARLREHPRGVLLEVPERLRHSTVRHRGGRVRVWHPVLVDEFARLLAGLDVPDDPQLPLRMIGLREMRSQNSWMHNSSALMRGAGRRHQARIHPQDAARAGVAHGEQVIIRSRTGQICTVAAVTDEVSPGTVAVPHGWGHAGGWQRANAAGGANSNALASSRPQDVEFLAGMSHLNGIPVAIEPGPESGH